MNLITIFYYDIICLQETWYKNSILNAEMIGSTDFNIFRKDREEFLSPKKMENGDVTLIKNKYLSEEINNEKNTQLEYQITRIKKGNSN